MSTMGRVAVVACVLAGLASTASAEPTRVRDDLPAYGVDTAVPMPIRRPAFLRRHVANVRLHDAARPLTRTAQVTAHEPPAPGVVRPRTSVDPAGGFQRVASLVRGGGACDSLLCPGYALIGVGF